jgi:transposase
MLKKLETMSVVTLVAADVSKDWFDVAVIVRHGRIGQRFAMKKKGFNEFRNWLKKHGISMVHLWMEATGHLSNDLALLAYRYGWQVTVVNPRCVRHFAIAQLEMNKSDKLDAKVILRFAESADLSKFRQWQPKSRAQSELRDVQIAILGLKKSLTEQRNRLKAGIASQFVKQSLGQIIANLNAQIKALQQEAIALIKSDPVLWRTYAVLEQIKGFGPATITFLLAKIDFNAFRKGRQLVKFAGLDSLTHESGTSVHKKSRISRVGHADLRAALYWPAIVAIRDDKATAEFAMAIAERKKSKMIAICAVMARLLRVAFARVRDDRLAMEAAATV